MTISTLPLRPAHCVDAQTNLLEAGEIMLREQINHLPVCEDGRYAGMLDMDDILSGVIPAAVRGPNGLRDMRFAGDMQSMLKSHVSMLRTQRVQDVMNRQIPALDPGCPLPEAMLLLSQHSTPLAVINEAQHVIGMLSARVVFGHLMGL